MTYKRIKPPGIEPIVPLEVYLGKKFNSEFKKSDIPKEKFCLAIKEIVLGQCDQLGHKLFKKRIGAVGRGKSGAYRAITYFRKGNLLIFVELFGKNEKENISDKELKELILLSGELDKLTKEKLEILIKENRFFKYDYVVPEGE